MEDPINKELGVDIQTRKSFPEGLEVGESVRVGAEDLGSRAKELSFFCGRALVTGRNKRSTTFVELEGFRNRYDNL